MESEKISLFQINNRNDGPQCLLCDINNPPPKRGKGDDKVDDMDSKKSKPRTQRSLNQGLSPLWMCLRLSRNILLSAHAEHPFVCEAIKRNFQIQSVGIMEV